MPEAPSSKNPAASSSENPAAPSSDPYEVNFSKSPGGGEGGAIWSGPEAQTNIELMSKNVVRRRPVPTRILENFYKSPGGAQFRIVSWKFLQVPRRRPVPPRRLQNFSKSPGGPQRRPPRDRGESQSVSQSASKPSQTSGHLAVQVPL